MTGSGGAYDRGGSKGVVHVSEHDRSPPAGGGGQSSGQGRKSWESKGNGTFRQKIAEAERSAEHANDGYGQRHPGGALGRYQITPNTLLQTGWKIGGTWTDKARQHGVTSDDDFLNSPEAQEAAMSDIMREAELQADSKGLYGHSGKTYNGVGGKTVKITDGGIAAAAHRHGAGATKNYLRRRANGQQAKTPEDRTRDKQIEKRLRDFENAPYTRGNW
ncbi:hypothetical protein [Magnetospirillum molischianum]|uniref:Uncharacterized protein n=1 Tax=Magnetospirillum molischianum DSM 120 TaxID=1150626 RepID=H8FWU6_MAGML|nr:hypothetical protein [Magnetospirillum molischianum]CCG42834.1 hypothetical protein PHAMO_470085 [Magnetospirillum molischianum DSM 120]